jgi:hypothetical protein
MGGFWVQSTYEIFKVSAPVVKERYLQALERAQ